MARTRREFIVTAGSGLAAGLLGSRIGFAQGAYPTTPTPPAIKIRKNVVNADAASDLASLKKGVAAMKELAQTNPNDGRGWIKQAFIHGDCNDFTFCQHGNWYFPPWHRSFIYYYEQLIAFYSGDPKFALPYWDWSRTHGVPASFYGSGNPLDDTVSVQNQCGPDAPTAGRGRTVNQQFSQSDLNTYVGPARISTIQSNPDYATYGGANPGTGALEGTPHNFVHRWVGGAKFSNMVQTFSPLDPIFWLHHCNIDRLYSNWLARPGHNPPPDDAWQSKSFNDFYDSEGNQVGSQFTCGMTVDSTVMGYQYDTDLDLPVSLSADEGKAATPKVVESVSAPEGKIAGGVLAFVAKPATRSTRQLMNAAASGSTLHRVRLRIEGVQTPERQNTSVDVFITQAGGSAITTSTPITTPGYVGSFTFFKGENRDANGRRTATSHHSSSTVLLDATDALQDLLGDVSLGEGQELTVSIVTRPLFEGAEHAKVEEVKPASIHFDMVEFQQ